MPSIPEHIKNLLFEQDCVVVPNFGGFITNFHSAGLHEQNGSLQPPRKRIAFNEILQFDDGLLSSYIAGKENRSRDEALSKIRSFSEHIWKELKLRKSFRFENLGVFTLNTEGKLVFEPDFRINFHAESFGLVAVPIGQNRKSLPLPTSFPKPRSVENPDQEVVLDLDTKVLPIGERRRWLSLPNMAASIGVIALSLVGWLWFERSDSSLSSLNPLSFFHTTEWVDDSRYQPERVAANSVPQPVVSETAEYTEIDLTLRPSLPTTVPPTMTKAAALSAVSPTAFPLKHGKALVVPMAVKLGAGKISPKSQRYYVVAGGFGKPANAIKLQKSLEQQGYVDVQLLFPIKKGLIKVSAGSFQSLSEAKNLADQVRGAYGNNVWILKNRL